MSVKAVHQKIARLNAGGRPRVLDLFAGCGGLSLGFQAQDFEIRAAVEFDPDAARSHGLNFHGGAPEHSQARDIITTHPEDLAAELDLGPVDRRSTSLSAGRRARHSHASVARNCARSKSTPRLSSMTRAPSSIWNISGTERLSAARGPGGKRARRAEPWRPEYR